MKLWNKLKKKAFGHGHHKGLTKSGKPKKMSSGQIWRQIRRQFPLISKMSLRTRVPSKMLERIREVAGNPSQRGLVRKIYYNNGKSVGYSALVLSNDSLTQAGFGKHYGNKKDFGRLIKDIRSNEIFTITLRGDIMHGYIVLRPDLRTLELMHAYSELNNCKFNWAIFPADLNPASGTLQSHVLLNLSSLKELLKLAKRKPPVALEVKNNEMKVVDKNSAKSSGNSSSADNSVDSQAVANSAKSSSSENKTLTQSIPTAKSSDNSSSASSSSKSNNSPYATFADVDSQSSESSSSENILSEELAKNTSSASNSDDNSYQKVDDESNTQVSSNSESGDSDNTQSEVSDFDSAMNNSDQASQEEADYESAMQANPIGQNRQQRNGHENQIPTKQSPADFYNQMEDADDRTFNDNSLGISINYDADLAAILRHETPPLFKIKKYSKNNRLGQLLNQYRTDCNSSLKADQQRMINNVEEDSISRISKVALNLEHRLSVNDVRTIYGQQMSNIGKTYDKQLRFDTHNTDKAVQAVEKHLHTMRSSYASRVTQEAMADFDEKYGDYPKQYRRKYEAMRHSKTHDMYLREKADLFKKRRHVANILAYGAWSRIMDNARDNVRSMYSKIMKRRKRMQTELVDLSTHYYEAENENEQNQAAVADNHNEINRLKRKFKREKADHDKQLAQERADNKRKQRETSEKFNRILKKAQHRANYYRKEYANEGEKRDKYYRKQSRGKDRELKNVRNRLNQRDNDIAEYLRSPKHVNQIWRNPWTYWIIAGLGLFAIFAAVALHHSISSNNSAAPYLGYMEHNDNMNSLRSSASASASSMASSMSASASSAVSAMSSKSHSSNTSSNTDLMTTRPDAGDGYVATSETHNPTNYVKIGKHNKFSTGQAVNGTVNGKSRSLQVITKNNNEVYLKDNKSGQIYEFNL